VAVDINRIAASALETFLEGGENEQSGSRRKRVRNPLGGVGAVALGVGLGVVARAAYHRARSLDLERVGGAIEEKLRH
jgi:hypothetical protein